MEININLQLLNAAKVAEILGISTSKVYRLMQTGDLPSVRMGRSVRVRKVDLDKFINNHMYHG